MITIQEVAKASKDYEKALAEFNDLYEIKKKEMYEGKLGELEAILDDAQEKVNQLQKAYKEQQIEQYQFSGEKSYPGGSIRVSSSYTYDEPLIIPWLREHGHDELVKESIDKTKVKKIAAAVKIPGIEVTENITASLAKDLSEYLD